MNPMIRKELRQRMRERRGWLLPSLYLLVLGAAVTFAYFIATTDRGPIQHSGINGRRDSVSDARLRATGAFVAAGADLQRRIHHHKKRNNERSPAC